MTEINLFKFRPINKYLFDSLVNVELYFPSPNELNDPFDCRLDINKSLHSAILQSECDIKNVINKLLCNNDAIKFLTNAIANHGVCSFTTATKNSVLWSHYADQHKGVCLKYSFPKTGILFGDIIGFTKVTYQQNSLTDWIKYNIPNFQSEGEFKKVDFMIELAKNLLGMKDVCWAYEQEYRLIKERYGCLKLTKEHLKEVCFGLNTSEEDIRTIRTLMDYCGYSVIFCKMIRNIEDFGITAIDI